MYYFGFAYCNDWSEKTFCTLLNRSKSKANLVATWLLTFFSSFTCKWFAFFNSKSSHCLCKVFLSNLIGHGSYVTFFYVKELNTSQFWGWLLSRKDVFFHLVNVKVHFRGRLELSLESICSFRPHKIPLFMLWKGINKGYQDKERIVFFTKCCELHYTILTLWKFCLETYLEAEQLGPDLTLILQKEHRR